LRNAAPMMDNYGRRRGVQTALVTASGVA